MQKNQNKIITAIVIIILVIVAVVTYYYSSSQKKTNQNIPTPCLEGDIYNIMTGKLCPGASPTSTTTIKSSN